MTFAYRSVNHYIRERFGEPLYKIALNGGFTCPNRDGSLGSGGCIFCSVQGSGNFASSAFLSIPDQIELGKAQVQHKIHRDKARYIAYFQAFTNTYAPPDVLEEKFMAAIRHPDIAVLSIATRPDCLGPEVLALIERLQTLKPVWVELGLQTIHPESAAYIRRGYPLSAYDTAVRNLASLGVEQIITHVILGLPGESEDMMMATVDYVGRSPSHGIKLQLLHVLRGTDLARDYAAGRFETLSMEAYTDLVVAALRRLPQNMVIHRMTGDGDRRELIAPLWSLQKWKVLNRIQEKLADISQEGLDSDAASCFRLHP